MDFFDLLKLIGGLSLFLFGMNIMGQALERQSGSRLRSLLGKLTTNKAMGLLTGLAVTAVIQSSSATTVMVVGFVWSDLLTNMERIADHCSNIAACLIDMQDENLNLHESLRAVRGSDPDFLKNFTAYEKKYALS